MTKEDKISFIKKWYTFRNDMCEKYTTCKECPLYESSDGWYDDESGKYKFVDNCKYEFEDTYAEDIIELMKDYYNQTLD